ncbi:LOW QUALITY PROTEIN: Gag protein, partial [Phytophthora palmivora]
MQLSSQSSDFGSLSPYLTWEAYTREATSPGCFTTWAQLCTQLRAAFLPANYEYRQRSRFLACKQGKRELHEYIQEMRVLAASLVGNPLPEHIKVTVLMDSLEVGPSRTRFFRVHANTMEEVIQIALQEEYSHRQARTPTSQDHNAPTGAVQGALATDPAQGLYTSKWVRPYRAPADVGSSRTYSVPALRVGKESFLPNLRLESSIAKATTQPPGPTKEDLSPHGRSADGARRGGLASESQGALETWKSSGGRLVVHARVQEYGDPFIILIDSGASTNFARPTQSHGMATSMPTGQVSVRLADGTVLNVPGIRMDLAVKLEDFDSTESFLVLDMDKYDLILGMPWLETHETWIGWRGKVIGVSLSAVSDRALVSNVPTSVRDWGRDGRQGAYAPEEVLGVTDSNEDVAMSLATGHETKAHCQACGIATTASPNAGSRRAVWASTVAVPDGTDQAGNIGPQAAEAAEESAKGVFCVGNIGPQAGNVVPQAGNMGPQADKAAEESAEGVSSVGNIGPQVGNIGPQAGNVVPQAGNIGPQADKAAEESAEGVSSVGNIGPQAIARRWRSQAASSTEEQCHVFDSVSGRQVRAGAVHLEALPEVSALLNLEELPMKDFLAELKAEEIISL